MKRGSLLSHFTKKEVDQAFATARPVAKRGPILVLAAPQLREQGRILPIVPKHIGNAPVRNKIRRQIRAIFYEERLYLCRHDLIVLFKRGALPPAFQDLKALLLRAAKRAQEPASAQT